MKLATDKLATSQRLFSEMLDSQTTEENFIALLEKNSRIPGSVATDIYRNNTIGTRKRALQAIYPVVEKIIGGQCFDRLALDFVTSSPSTDSDLNLYGAGFPEFLQRLCFNEDAFSDFPYLRDLACLEWLYHKAYYAADDLPLSASQIDEIESSVKLERSHSLFCMKSPYPVVAIWRNHQGNASVSEVAALASEDYILIARQQGHPLVRQIDRQEWSIIQSIDGQTELDAVVQSALVEDVEIEKKLPLMIERGWLSLNQ